MVRFPINDSYLSLTFFGNERRSFKTLRLIASFNIGEKVLQGGNGNGRLIFSLLDEPKVFQLFQAFDQSAEVLKRQNNGGPVPVRINKKLWVH